MGMRLKQIAWILLLAIWLPQGPVGGATGSNPPSARSFPVASTAPQLSAQKQAAALHFHQLRFGDLQSWLVRGLPWDTEPPRIHSVPPRPLVHAATALAVERPAETASWRFRQRTALPPRAPCPA